MLLHVSILRSSSGSTYCSLLKLHVKIVNMSLYLSVMWQHIVYLCVRCFQCREVCRLALASLHARTADCRFRSLEVALWVLAKLAFHLHYLCTYAINCSKALCQETKESDKEPKIMKFFLSEGIPVTHLGF